MQDLIPPFDINRVFVSPWVDSFHISIWIVLMGFFVTATCGLVGNYLVLRRMALVGDAISHSILPGLVMAFIIFKQNSSWVMFFGALVAGIVTVALIEFIHKQSRIKTDAAICISFTILFALGVAMISQIETQGPIHIDAECVLYGEIAFVPLEPNFVLGGWELGPLSVLRMAGIFVVIAAAIGIFYKEMLVTSFDAGLSKSLGMRTGFWHYALMCALAIAVVGAFESVGAILAVAMLIVPPMFAAELSDRLPVRLGLTVFHGGLSALLGYHLSIWLQCSAAGAMVVAAGGLFVLAWFYTRIRRLLQVRRAAETEFPETAIPSYRKSAQNA